MADKTFDKCSKCRVTNLMEATVCRNCKTPLPWAASASSAPVAPVSFDPLSASPAATTVAITTSNTQSRTRSQSATSSFVQDPNKPPQVYQGAPPSRDGYEAKKPAMNPAPFYAGGAIVALLALFFVMRMLAPAPTQAIENLEAHTTKDNVFACQGPVGWEMRTGGRSDGLYGSSQWTSGSAQILVSDDLAGSLMSEGAPPPGKTKVQALHERSERMMSEKYANYQEEAASRVDNGFGETWKCEFTANGGFRVGEIRGIRATMLAADKRIKLVATCRTQDWDKLKDGFERVLMSIGAPTTSPGMTVSSAAVSSTPTQ